MLTLKTLKDSYNQKYTNFFLFENEQFYPPLDIFFSFFIFNSLDVLNSFFCFLLFIPGLFVFYSFFLFFLIG